MFIAVTSSSSVQSAHATLSLCSYVQQVRAENADKAIPAHASYGGRNVESCTPRL